jgi:hypothetical protein
MKNLQLLFFAEPNIPQYCCGHLVQVLVVSTKKLSKTVVRSFIVKDGGNTFSGQLLP